MMRDEGLLTALRYMAPCCRGVEIDLGDGEAMSNYAILIIGQDEAAHKDAASALSELGYPEAIHSGFHAELDHLCRELDPDLVVLLLPEDGEQDRGLLQSARGATTSGQGRSVLAVTANASASVRARLLRLGADDVLVSPYEGEELLLRVRGLLRSMTLREENARHRDLLEEAVRERTREVVQAQMEAIDRLAAAAECRDDSTGQHIRRVGDLSAALGEVLNLEQRQVSLLRRAAPLHDIGKIGIPDAILLKPGSLTAEEFEIVKTHTLIGSRILSGGDSPLLKVAEEIARTHHERWDGLGYPYRLSGPAIPQSGRVVAVADAFDALTHERCYKPAWSIPEAVEEIRSGKETRYDPAVVEALLHLHGSGQLADLVSPGEGLGFNSYGAPWSTL